MIKVQNEVASREPLPAFLIGLAAESLCDLSWTDPSLGVSDCAWWPEEDQSAQLGQYERYGDEVLTIDAERELVVVVRAVVPWTTEEVAADIRSRVPQQVTSRQATQALIKRGLDDDVEAALNAIPDPVQRKLAIAEYAKSQVFERYRPLVIQIGAVLNLDLDELFTFAATL